MKSNFFFMYFFLILVLGCSPNNDISIDYKNKVIFSSSTSGITKIDITDEKDYDYYFISWEEKSRAPNKLYLNKIDRRYYIKKNSRIYKKDSILFKPNSTIVISNHKFDRAAYRLKVYTDSTGQIYIPDSILSYQKNFN